MSEIHCGEQDFIIAHEHYEETLEERLLQAREAIFRLLSQPDNTRFEEDYRVVEDYVRAAMYRSLESAFDSMVSSKDFGGCIKGSYDLRSPDDKELDPVDDEQIAAFINEFNWG